MTCIVALKNAGVVWMGGDSAAVAGWSMDLTADPKVFRVGELLIGYSTSFRMGQLLQFGWEIPSNHENNDGLFMRTGFIDSVRARLTAGGFTKVENSREEGGSFLVGYRGEIYEVASDFQVLRSVHPFAALGCGASLALGSLASTPRMEASKRVALALRVAERLNAGVRGPFSMESA